MCVSIFVYLALGAATHSVKLYHWFMLLAVPAALLAAERGRRFFVDLAPLFAFWLIYDRLRLLQPLLLDRVAVRLPYAMERWLFGWAAGGDVPAHAGRVWLAAQAGTFYGAFISWSLQLVYLSHLFALPLFMFWLWWQGYRDARLRERFVRHIRAFTLLNFVGLAMYVLLPVAPPWWVTLNGIAQPTVDLVTQVNISAAMEGSIVQALIRNAAQWFAAVPSMHGAYPVLLALLALKDRSRWIVAAFALYGAAMWTATVMLNQHYIIDLLAGAILAVAAWLVAGSSINVSRELLEEPKANQAATGS